MTDYPLDNLLDLESSEKGYGSALYAAWDISLCCSLSCTCTSCE